MWIFYFFIFTSCFWWANKLKQLCSMKYYSNISYMQLNKLFSRIFYFIFSFLCITVFNAFLSCILSRWIYVVFQSNKIYLIDVNLYKMVFLSVFLNEYSVISLSVNTLFIHLIFPKKNGKLQILFLCTRPSE